MGKLVPAAALLFVIVPSELLGFLSNKYRSHLNPKTETLVRKLGRYELAACSYCLLLAPCCLPIVTSTSPC